jgi:cell division inhibitor SepF
MSQYGEAEQYDQPRNKSKSLFSWDRIKGLWDNDEYEEEDDEDVDETAATAKPGDPRAGGSVGYRRPPAPALRLESARRTHVIVRRAVQSFDDARRAADGLKSGQQQIINLETTDPDMAERIIDFLNGATYALDGSVEKIGEQVYLFTPHNICIDVEEKPAPTTRASFLDRA